MTSFVTIQNALNAGELSPSLFGRTDLKKWENGCSTVRNFFVDYKGGVKSRAGFAYVGTSKQGYSIDPDSGAVTIADALTVSPPRDIPFQFNIDQGYALEFGTEYMRVKSRGAYVTETSTINKIANPNLGAIEAYVGADTPVGYHNDGGVLLEERSVPYLVQLEGALVGTGDPGIKVFGQDTTGSELIQATVATIGVADVIQGLGSLLHPNGNIYSCEAASNSTLVDIIDPATLTLLNTFGTPGATLGSDASHIAESFQMIPVITTTQSLLLSCGLTSANHINEVSLWDTTGDDLAFIGKTTTTEAFATACEGNRGFGDFYVLGSINYGLGAATPFSLYSGTSSGAPVLTSVASIAPTDVDATWTNFSNPRGPGYDNADGNLLVIAITPDTVSQKQYLVKVEITTGDIIWTCPISGTNATRINLSSSYMNGILQYFDKGTNAVITVDLTDGSTTSTAWNTGFLGGRQIFDHSLGMIFMNSGYTQNTGPVPTYLGSYLAGHGNVIPANRWMSMYSTPYTPGETITETGYTITNITQANPAVITVDPAETPPWNVGDWVYIRDVQGMTNFNGLTWIIDTFPTPGDPNSFTVVDLFGNVVDSTNFDAYVSGGVIERLFTLTTPYQGEDLAYLKYTQSADVMTLTCVNPNTGTEYPPQTLTRLGNADWTIEPVVFAATIQPPTDITITAQSSDTPSTWYSYVVTAVDAETGEESVQSEIVTIQNNDISISLGSNRLSWTAVPGAGSYNIYSSIPSYSAQVTAASSFGFLGTSIGSSFTDNNITPDFTVVPPIHFDPFAVGAVTDVVITAGGDGNYSQSTIGWSVTTSTGSGFDGFPIVAEGQLVGFVITNQGSGYLPADTITFTDSGGGLARGNYHVTSQPSDGDHLTINTVSTITFRDAANLKHPSFEVGKGATIPLTLASLNNFYSVDVNASIFVADYTHDDSHFYITYKTPGSVGNAFTLGSGPSGWTRSGATLTGGGVAGTGATATLTVGPQTGTYPSVPAYFQQRRVYAASQNEPDTYWMSQPGNFNNMDSSIPVTDSDSITGTPWSQQVNRIQTMTPMPGGLVVFTGNGAWQVNGGGAAAITPSNQSAQAQAYNGCSATVIPLPINNHILYVQAKGSIARDLAYNFYTNIYTGTDLTVLSNHLFTYNTVTQWCWNEEPFKLIWALRNDGTLLSLTYLPEQDVISWTRHDTNGLFVSVCSITEPPVDALYVITQRYVQGQWRYYSERMNNRLWENVEGAFCVDSGVSYPEPNEVNGLAYLLTYPTQPYFPDAQTVILPTGTLTSPASTGTGIQFTTIDTVEDIFSSDNIGWIVRMGGGKATITSVIDANNFIADITEDITTTVPNDPDEKPLPAIAGAWSLSPPVTIIPNLNHLEGIEVAILADGSVVPNQVVTDGKITLDQDASVVTIGFPFTAQLQTLYLEKEDRTGTAQNRRKNISAVGLRVEQSRGLTVGADQPDASTQPNYATVPWTNMNEIKERTNQTDAGTAVPLYTGDYYKTITSGWDLKGQVAVQQTYPLPANILSVISYWNVGDDK